MKSSCAWPIGQVQKPPCDTLIHSSCSRLKNVYFTTNVNAAQREFRNSISAPTQVTRTRNHGKVVASLLANPSGTTFLVVLTRSSCHIQVSCGYCLSLTTNIFMFGSSCACLWMAQHKLNKNIAIPMSKLIKSFYYFLRGIVLVLGSFHDTPQVVPPRLRQFCRHLFMLVAHDCHLRVMLFPVIRS